MNNGRFNEWISADEELLWDERGYANCWEHYADELQLLDSKLQWLYYKRKKRMTEWQADPFNGLFVSEEEFMGLITIGPDPTDGDPEALMLMNRLQAREEAVRRRLASSELAGVSLPLPYVAKVFGMLGWERQCVMAALAVELDRKYERIFGFLIDDLTCKHPNISLLLQLACRDLTEMSAARVSLASSGKLATYMFHREEGDVAVRSQLSKPVWLDRRILRFLLDEATIEPGGALDRVTHRTRLNEPLPALRIGSDLQERLQSFVRETYAPERKVRKRLAFYIWGPSGGGKKLQVQHCCKSFNKPVLFANMASMLLEDKPFSELLDEVLREAILHQAVLCLTHVEALFPDEPDLLARQRLQTVYRGLNGYNGLLFLLADKHQRLSAELKDRLVLDMELPIPDDGQRRVLWESYAAESGFDHPVDWAVFGSKFRFTAGQISRALALAQGFAAWGGTGAAPAAPAQQAEAAGHSGGNAEAALYKACYMQVQHRLEKKAARIQPKYAWDDIILPVEQKEQLRQACNQMKYRATVYGQWGFERKLAYGKGLSMLFAGPPGTGKTMSAQVVAKELQLELYKIDLSQVISKYIGETEKNLHEIFEEARLSNAILFFDETDALFGKRSEVKDSHDKYANIETAYLLQKMEEYEGITVLATNLLNNIDEAFIRRISYIIKFPFPDEEHREKIWRSMFPKEAPIGPDVDFKYVATKFSIAGGNIKNIAVSSAFMAADAGTVIGMRHILQAVKYELQKTGKIWNKDDVDMY
jgi:AAA+ superfamily predicted ATPase